MQQLIGRRGRTREWVDTPSDLLVAGVSDGILCPQFRRASADSRVVRYFGLLDVDANLEAVQAGRAPLVKDGAVRQFASRKSMYTELWQHLGAVARTGTLRQLLESVPAVWAACKAARDVAAELTAAQIPAVAYFSGKKGARVLFRNDDCFVSVRDEERYGDVIFEKLLPDFMRRHQIASFDRLRALVDAAVYRPKSGIRADVHRRGRLFPAPLIDGPDGLDGPALRDEVVPAQLRIVQGFWQWCRAAATRVEPGVVTAPARGTKRGRADDSDSVSAARLRFHSAFAATLQHSFSSGPDGRLQMLPCTGLVPRAVRSAVATGQGPRPTHCLQTAANPNEEFIIEAAEMDPDALHPAQEHVLRALRLSGDEALTALSTGDDASIAEQARRVGRWVEGTDQPPPPLQEVVGAARCVRFFFDWDDIPATLEQLLCVQRAVEQVFPYSRMVVLTNSEHPAKRHLVFPALVLTPQHCGALARMVSDCAEIRQTFGDDAVPRVADISPYSGYLRMPGCPKVCKRTGVVKARGGIYWPEAVFEPGGHRRLLREFGTAAMLYQMGCLQPFTGETPTRLECLERYDRDQSQLAKTASASSTPRCSPRSGYLDAVRKSCIVVHGPAFPERAFCAQALNEYFKLPRIIKLLQRRGGGSPRELVEADLVTQMLPPRGGYDGKVSIRTPGVPCFCLIGQRFHRNAANNVYFLIGQNDMQQRCWHNSCRALDKDIVKQRSPWVPIQATAARPIVKI